MVFLTVVAFIVLFSSTVYFLFAFFSEPKLVKSAMKCVLVSSVALLVMTSALTFDKMNNQHETKQDCKR